MSAVTIFSGPRRAAAAGAASGSRNELGWRATADCARSRTWFFLRLAGGSATRRPLFQPVFETASA